MVDIDTLALAVTHQILGVDHVAPYVQRKARIQCIIVDALRAFASATASPSAPDREAVTNDPIREAIDRGGGQCCDVEGVLRELTTAGYVIATADLIVRPVADREAIANAIINSMPILRGLNAALDAIISLPHAPARDDVISYYYVRNGYIFKRPVRVGENITMGFPVCLVCDGVDAEQVCAILNRGEPATG